MENRYFRRFNNLLKLESKENKKFIVFLLCLVAILTFRIYITLRHAFFQQDEWAAFGFIAPLKDTDDILKYIFVPTSGHYNPLSSLAAILLYSFFDLHYEAYLIISIILHIIVILLLFKFTNDLFGSMILALFAAAFFALNASHYQATSWILADIPTHGATILGLLSLITFQKFLKSPVKRYLFLTILFLILSLLFKEITLGLFIILPIMYYIYSKKAFLSNLKYVGIIYFVFFAFILIKISPYAPNLKNFGIGQNSRQLLFNVATFPINGISQSLFYSPRLLELGNLILPYLPIPKSVSGNPGTIKYGLFIEKRLMIFINASIVIMFGAILAVISRNKKNALYTKHVLFGLLFAGVNSIVYAFSPGRTGIIALMDSRNLYLPSIGVAVAIISLLYVLSRKNHKMILLLILPYLYFNILWMQRQFAVLNDMGGVRKQILYQIKYEYPDLPDKIIIYTESDTSYYGLPTNQKILPFQSGFGQTLLVWYSKNENWPPKFHQNYFLWKITDQGYMESEDRGFGYFRDMEEMKKIIKKFNLGPENVISFSWSSKNRILKNTTKEVRRELMLTRPDQ